MSEIDRDQSPQHDPRASLIHELRTPLNAILAWAQVLGPDADRADLERGLRTIARNARLQAGLIDRLASGNPVDLRDMVAEPPEPSPDLSGVRVLVVDDEEAARNATVTMVTRAGAEAVAVASAAEALEHLRAQASDVLVSDITMSGMDGYALLRAVRADGSSRVGATPAIALTALTSSRARQRAYQAGFQLHLAKPIDAVELCLAIASLVKLLQR